MAHPAMRRAKWRIRRELEGLPGIAFRRVPDPEGDTGAFLITTYKDAATCKSVVEALKAEGMVGRGYAKPCISMEEWGLHWYFNNKSLVNRKSLHSGGWPWSLPQNEFARGYGYGKGSLPACDDYAARAALLKVPSSLSDEDVADIVAAYRKVAAHYL